MPEPKATRSFIRGRKARWAIVVLGAAAAAVGLRLAFHFQPKDSVSVAGELTYDVSQGDLRISFTERGNVKASRSLPIYSQLEGEHTILSLVAEGVNVREGDVLVELDVSDLQQQLNQQQIAVDTAAADYLQAEELLEIQRSSCESEIQKAKLDLHLAELDLEKYLSPKGEYELAMMKSNADMTIAEEELTRARNTLEWTQKLADRGYVSGTELIADRLNESKAKVQLDQAIGGKALLENFTHKKDMAKYESGVSEGRAALERSGRKSKATITQYEAAKKGKESTLNLSRRRLAKLQDQIAKGTITAPQDGMVVYPNVEPWRRERMIMQGSTVHESQRLMDLPDISTMAVDVQVHESWVDQVKEGLPSLVSIDALPNINLRGNVTRVGLLPDSVNRWLNPDLKVYQTEITLDSGADIKLLRPGMSAKVEILIAVLKDVVYVPVQSVTTIDKQQVCFVLEGEQFVAKPVQGGRYNEAFIEIVSGLKAGDRIQLNAPAPKGGKNVQNASETDSLAREIEAAERASVPREKARRANEKPRARGAGDVSEGGGKKRNRDEDGSRREEGSRKERTAERDEIRNSAVASDPKAAAPAPAGDAAAKALPTGAQQDATGATRKSADATRGGAQ
jgi:HlyD family secretion protein